MTNEHDPKPTSYLLSGVLVFVYSALALLASFAVWAYSENFYIWLWQYQRLELLSYVPYSNLLKAISMGIGVVGLLGLAYGLVLLLDGLNRQARSV